MRPGEDEMTRGRPPLGAGHVDGLDGSESSKERLRLILETLSGELTIAQACDQLGIGETRYHKLRREALSGALDALEPRAPGRPRRVESDEEQRIRELEAQVGDLEEEIVCSRVRLELALTMPHVLKIPDGDPLQKRVAEIGHKKRKRKGRRG